MSNHTSSTNPFASVSQVQVLGSTTEPDAKAATEKLKANIVQEPYKSLVSALQLEFSSRIGGGYYSDVFRAKIDAKGETKLDGPQVDGPGKFIVKIVDATRCPKKSNYDSELAICKMLKAKPHAHIASVLYLAEFPTQFWIFMQHCGRHLTAFLAKCSHPCGRLSESIGRNFFLQLASAIEYLHTRNVVHRDIKPENVLISKQYPRVFVVTLIDFGFAKVLPDRKEKDPALCTSHKGTLEFMAPELLVPNIYGYDAIKADIYSLGTLLYLMLHGASPFFIGATKPARSLAQLIEAYHDLKLSPIPFPALHHRDHNRMIAVSSSAQKLLTAMLAPKPEKRATLNAALKHSWIINAASKRDDDEEEKQSKKSFGHEYPSTESF